MVVSPVHSIEIESISDAEEFEQLVLLLQECRYNIEFDLPTTASRRKRSSVKVWALLTPLMWHLQLGLRLSLSRSMIVR